MRKEVINYLIFWFGYFVLVTIFNSLYSFNYWPLYLGGLVGLFMSNLDHLLHVFVLKPQELTSQRVVLLIRSKQVKEALNLLYDTREERRDLMFHTVIYQIVFAVLTFWVITSSGNLFGRGLVLGYFLSLTIYNLKKFVNKELIFGDADQTRIYFVVQVILLFVFGLLV